MDLVWPAGAILAGALQPASAAQFLRDGQQCELCRGPSGLGGAAVRHGSDFGSVHRNRNSSGADGPTSGAHARAAAVTAGVAILLLWITQQRHIRWGRLLHTAHSRKLQSLRQSLAAVKEAKILGRERYFGRRFAAIRSALGDLEAMQLTTEALPRLVVETTFVIALAALILLAWLRPKAAGNLTLTPGIFAYGRLRFANPSPRSGWVEDFHFLAARPAQRTLLGRDYSRPGCSTTRHAPARVPSQLPVTSNQKLLHRTQRHGAMAYPHLPF